MITCEPELKMFCYFNIYCRQKLDMIDTVYENYFLNFLFVVQFLAYFINSCLNRQHQRFINCEKTSTDLMLIRITNTTEHILTVINGNAIGERARGNLSNINRAY